MRDATGATPQTQGSTLVGGTPALPRSEVGGGATLGPAAVSDPAPIWLGRSGVLPCARSCHDLARADRRVLQLGDARRWLLGLLHAGRLAGSVVAGREAPPCHDCPAIGAGIVRSMDAAIKRVTAWT